jgi:hypothetical protein
VVQLLRTATVAEAHIVAALLEEHGIRARAVDLGVDALFTGQPQGGRVLVRTHDAQRAREVLTDADTDQVTSVSKPSETAE